MKQHYAASFEATLAAFDLSPHDWRTLTRRSTARRTRWIRQCVRAVQRAHTGKGCWWRGRYVRKP